MPGAPLGGRRGRPSAAPAGATEALLARWPRRLAAWLALAALFALVLLAALGRA